MDRAAVTAVAVLFGPASVRGPCPVRGELVRAGLDFLDDRDTIVDDLPVSVDSVLREIIGTVVGGDGRVVDGLVLVCPGWWPSARLDRIRAAATAACAEAVVVTRAHVHRRRHPGADILVEITDEFVLAATADTTVLVVPRRTGVAAAVAAGLDEPASVLIDAPGGVAGARAVATEMAAGLRRGGEVAIVGDHQLLQTAGDMCASPADPPRHRWPWVVVVCLLAAATAVAVALHRPPREPSDRATVLITEGRVAARVPADWVVERITAGTGSRRVQVTESGGERALLIVQSPAEVDMATTATTLASALHREDPTVFTDFEATRQRAGRPVISYTEARAGRKIEWSVFLEGGVRIAVGCQSTIDRDAREICDQTIASAHSVR
ncbi:type VII secretion-associated protein [Mycobacterium hackensackense]|uniref:type VII secretion-associated protein n=1 Tax=Mycobacterium hackensackense TaxID=228909 RepID=UPI00226596DA|nr:type VII secretion-associated protein [Mycobacterium hackensackense]MCV7256127.1 type VII secretion-associated protein [Mycobacterium hackensackense]